jgi:predicted acetyltransferase
VTGLVLRAPDLDLLPAYAAALRQGWSPNNVRDVSGEQLAEIAADADAFIRRFTATGGTVKLGDGRLVPRLPGPTRWMWDGAFCGAINLRHQPGTETLPEHVLGHIGYGVVPWKRRRGYATEALRLMLPLAADLGLRHVDLTCDHDNRPSQLVIEANGGTLVSRTADADRPGHDKLLFRIRLA